MVNRPKEKTRRSSQRKTYLNATWCSLNFQSNERKLELIFLDVKKYPLTTQRDKIWQVEATWRANTQIQDCRQRSNPNPASPAASGTLHHISADNGLCHTGQTQFQVCLPLIHKNKNSNNHLAGTVECINLKKSTKGGLRGQSLK